MPDDQSKRKAGVLLHISSLPSGKLGSDAYRFVDFLSVTGASIWQTLPINMPHADNSPYQCISAHAGNTAFICLQALVQQGLITDSDIALGHHQALNVAHSHFVKEGALDAFVAFCAEHQCWLEDYALYSVLGRLFTLRPGVNGRTIIKIVIRMHWISLHRNMPLL